LAKIISVILIILVFSLAVPSFAQETNNIQIAFVTDIGGLNDNSYNDQIWEGLEDAVDDLSIELKVLESKLMTDYLPNLNKLVEEKSELIWAVGFSMQESLKEAAQMYPETHFVLVDGRVELENVLSVNFAVEEGAFLAGAAAALKSESGKIAFIGGRENNILKRYQRGFTRGALRADEDVELIIRYTGNFTDPTKAGDTAVELFENHNVDVIFHAAGPGSKSVIDAALKNDFYLIGVNSADNNLASENILTNVIKKISFITENETKNFYRGDFKTGTKIYDLASGGIGLDQDQAEKTLSKDVLDKLEEYKKMIIDGRIDISNKTSQ
jgi:basic membrane protein A